MVSSLEVMVVWRCFSTIAWPNNDGAPMQADHGISRQVPPLVVCQDSAPPIYAPQEERGGGELMAVHLVFCTCMLATGCIFVHEPCNHILIRSCTSGSYHIQLCQHAISASVGLAFMPCMPLQAEGEAAKPASCRSEVSY